MIRFILTAILLLGISHTANSRPSEPEFCGDRYCGAGQVQVNYMTDYETTKVYRKKYKAAKTKPVTKKLEYATVGEFNFNPVEAITDAVKAVIIKPARFIAGRLICAVNVNATLKANGIKGTGSAWAKSFLKWGKPSKPVPGAVAVYNRGGNRNNGHVAIVAKVVKNTVWIWNPSPRGWRLMPQYKQPIAYRVAAT